MSTAEVDIGRGQVVETLVIAPQVVVVDELGEALFELTWQVVVLRVGSGSSWSGDSARSCPGSSGDKACRGYGSCRAPASQEPSWADRYDGHCRSTAAAAAGPGRAPTRNCAVPSSVCRRHRWRSWWCTASRPGCSARSHRAGSTDRTSPSRSPADKVGSSVSAEAVLPPPVSDARPPNRTGTFRYASGSPGTMANAGVCIQPRRNRSTRRLARRNCSVRFSRQTVRVGRTRLGNRRIVDFFRWRLPCFFMSQRHRRSPT